MWYAQWRDKDKSLHQRPTDIPVIMEGKSKRETRLAALKIAEVFESGATGLMTMEEMMEHIRVVLVSLGFGKPIPSVKEFLSTIPATSRASSERNRVRAHKVFLEFLGKKGNLPLTIITPALCREFLRWALALVKYNTVRQYRTYISHALHYAVVEKRYLPHNPMEMAQVSTEMRVLNIEREESVRKPFTTDEMRLMMHNLPRPWCDMVAVSYYLAGLRLSDVCMLRWDGLDFGEEIARMKEVKTHNGRDISLLPELKERLLAIRTEQGGKGAEEYVFPKMAKQYGTSASSRISTDFTNLLKAYGILSCENDGEKLPGRRHRVNPKSFHSIRHSAVTFARINPALTPDMVRDTIGHSSEAVERRYFTADNAAKAKVMEALADAVKIPTDEDKPAA